MKLVNTASPVEGICGKRKRNAKVKEKDIKSGLKLEAEGKFIAF